MRQAKRPLLDKQSAFQRKNPKKSIIKRLQITSRAPQHSGHRILLLTRDLWDDGLAGGQKQVWDGTVILQP
jgi:hypothetical protein